MNTNLKEIHGMNQFCGPRVMAALTGKSTDECAAVISAVSGRQEIRAVSVAHLIEAFKRLRFEMKLIDKYGYTLFANLNGIAGHEGMYIILVPKHVVAVEVSKEGNIYLIDNHSKAPIPAEGSARLSQKCDGIYKITAKSDPKLIRRRVITDLTHSNVYIRAIDEYENPEDNVRLNLGQFTFRTDDELHDIIFKLSEMRNHI